MSEAVELIAVGGLGQFGMNCAIVRCGGSAIVIDVGLAFPGSEPCGVDAIVPDITSVLGEGVRAEAIVATHGHEDHIGGLPRALAATGCPVYGSDITLGLLADKLAQRGVPAGDRLHTVRGRAQVDAGPFRIEFLDVTHSVPGTLALAIRTPAGTIVHSADFKLDPTPLEGPVTDEARLQELGAEGVRLLMIDSTGADVAGRTPSERSVIPAFTRIFKEASARVVIATFSSHLPRILAIAEAAAHSGRRLAVLGRRMSLSVAVARAAGRLPLPPGLLVSSSDLARLPRERCVVVAGGAQGEPLSAMARISRGEHPDLAIAPGDVVIHAARAIPGEERAILDMLNALARSGARVISGPSSGFHVSGHAGAQDLASLIAQVRPRSLVPVHGDYRRLAACAALAPLAAAAAAPAPQALVAQNGDIIRVEADGVRIAGSVAPRLIFEDHDHERIEAETVRERRQMAEAGILMPVLIRERATGRLMATPTMHARGFSEPHDGRSLMAEAVSLVAAAARAAGEGPETALRERIQDELRRLVKRRTGRRTVVAPIVLEI